MSASLSPLIHLIDDDAAVRQSVALLISTVGLRVQTWADPLEVMRSFDRQSVGAIVLVRPTAAPLSVEAAELLEVIARLASATLTA